MQKIFFLIFFMWICFSQKNALSLPLDALEGFLVSYQDFLSEDIAKIQLRITQNPDDPKVSLETAKNIMMSCHSKTTETLDRLERIKQTAPSIQQKEIETLLQELLLERLDRLKTRTDDIVKSLKEKRMIISTNPLYYPEGFDYSDPDYLAILDSAKTDWQFHQLFIKHVFLTVDDPFCLCVKTKTLLQLSPSLWDLLTYKTYDTGNSDQAGGYAAFWWLQNHFDSLEDLAFVKENPVSTAMHLYKRIVIDHELFFDPEQTRVYKKILRTLDGELYRAYTDRYIQRHEKNFMLGGENQPFTLIKTPMEAGLWGEDLLQKPDWLFTRKETPIKADALSPASTTEIKLPQKNGSFPIGTKNPQPYKETLHTPSSASIREIKKESGIILQEMVPLVGKEDLSLTSISVSQESTPDEIEAASLPSEQAIESPSKAAINQEETKKVSPPRLIEKEFVFPRGIRLFHPESTKQAIPTLSHPDKKIQEFVNALFDPAQLSHITFSDFQHHWERLGGSVVENRGGSHRQLIAPDRKPLWGIFDHGGFGKKTIGYLQAAFWSQGYRPEK